MDSKASHEPYSPLREEEEAHWEVEGHIVTRLLTVLYYYCLELTRYCSFSLQVVERILFIHAKVNKGIGYVQVCFWMKEICTATF